MILWNILKRTDNASERIVLRGGGGVFQEKTGGNAVNLTNLHRVDTKSRRISPFPLLFCWILMKSNKKRLNFLHSQRKSKRFCLFTVISS